MMWSVAVKGKFLSTTLRPVVALGTKTMVLRGAWRREAAARRARRRYVE